MWDGSTQRVQAILRKNRERYHGPEKASHVYLLARISALIRLNACSG